MPQNFCDFLTCKSQQTQSVLCAGLDPNIEAFPRFFMEEAKKNTVSNQEFYKKVITNFYLQSLEIIKDNIAGVKPNIAFFEQYGIGGLEALIEIKNFCKKNNLPLILDCKRGDIGSTAQAYVNAYLLPQAPFEADAITVNPFLGFDTVEVFLKACIDNHKGMFILVKTSNSGSSDIQDLKVTSNSKVSDHIANWIAQVAKKNLSSDNLSSIGAVIGATYPKEIAQLRDTMPNSIFLIPGYGAQGGLGKDLKPAFKMPFIGAIINASRGLFNAYSSLDITLEAFSKELENSCYNLNKPLKDLFD